MFAMIFSEFITRDDAICLRDLRNGEKVVGLYIYRTSNSQSNRKSRTQSTYSQTYISTKYHLFKCLSHCWRVCHVMR